MHAYWNTVNIWPYSGAFGFGHGTPTFGASPLISNMLQAPQWSYLGAIYMNDPTQISVGGVNPDAISLSNPTLTTYNVVSGADKWTIALDSISWQSGQFTNNVEVASNMEATFDIDKMGIYVPPNVFGTISTQWRRKTNRLYCKGNMCYFDDLCSTVMEEYGLDEESFVFKFGNVGYKLPWSAYFADTQLMTCALLIQAHSDSNVVLGQAFLKHFYTLYDIEAKQVSIALGRDSWGSVSN